MPVGYRAGAVAFTMTAAVPMQKAWSFAAALSRNGPNGRPRSMALWLARDGCDRAADTRQTRRAVLQFRVGNRPVRECCTKFGRIAHPITPACSCLGECDPLQTRGFTAHRHGRRGATDRQRWHGVNDRDCGDQDHRKRPARSAHQAQPTHSSAVPRLSGAIMTDTKAASNALPGPKRQEGTSWISS